MMKIAVIGAGVSGLVTARELKARGHTVKVFEKSRGRGGRIATRRSDWGDINIGAQYFTARSESFQREVNLWHENRVADVWSFTPYRVTEDGGITPSPDNTRRSVGIPSMNRIAHFLASELDLALNTRIKQLVKGSSGWTLVSEENEQFRGYDWVVVTTPAEQARYLAYNNTHIMDKVAPDVHSPCWALAMATVGNVAGDIQGIFGDDTVGWVSRLSALPGRAKPKEFDDLWMLHFSARWSRQHPRDSKIDFTAIGIE